MGWNDSEVVKLGARDRSWKAKGTEDRVSERRSFQAGVEVRNAQTGTRDLTRELNRIDLQNVADGMNRGSFID
jgi:hypothetical protein